MIRKKCVRKQKLTSYYAEVYKNNAVFIRHDCRVEQINFAAKFYENNSHIKAISRSQRMFNSKQSRIVHCSNIINKTTSNHKNV